MPNLVLQSAQTILELCYLNNGLDDNFCDNHKFIKKMKYWYKNQNNREKVKILSMREKIIKKIVKNGCINIISPTFLLCND